MALLRGHSIEEQWDLAEQFEGLMETSISEVTNKFIANQALTAAAPPGDGQSYLIQAWTYEVDTNLAPFVYQTYSSGALELQHDALNSLPVPAGAGIPGVPDHFTADFVNQQANKLKGISQDLWQNIQQELAAGVAAGESVEKLADRVREAASITMPRALVIARTQVMAASNAGSYAQASLIADSTMQKQWVATEDSRTREDHVHADQQIVPMTGMFIVGGWSMSYPGDFMAPAGEVVNCRCTLGYLFDNAPSSLCACDAATEEALVSAGFASPQVYSGLNSFTADAENCACPVTPTLQSPLDYHSPLTDWSYLQQKQLYQLFQGEQKISPAYGGAKIHKQLQEVHKVYNLTSDDDSVILNIVDNFYGKSSFKKKYSEWLNSSAGKKAVAKGPEPTIIKKPPVEVPQAPAVIDPLDISTVPQQAVDKLYAVFKANKPVTPNWGGSAIYKNLEAIKSQLVGPEWAGLNDGQLLKILDKAYGTKGKSFYDETEKWLQTPNGKKYLQEQAKPPLPKPLDQPKPPVEGEAVEAPATPVPDVPAGDISGIGNFEQQMLYMNMKKLGAYIASPDAKIFDILQTMKKTNDLVKKLGLNDLQLLKIMDNQGAIKFGTEDKHIFEKKIADWLQTPQGKDYATKHEYVKPKPAKPYKPTPLGEVEEVHPITPVSQSQGAQIMGKTKYGGTKGPLTLQDLVNSINSSIKEARRIEKYSGVDSDYPVFTPTQASAMWRKLGGGYNTAEGEQGIRFYTGEYTQVNGGLRTGMHVEEYYVKMAKKAIQGFKPSDRPMMLHRGTGGLSFGLPDYGATLEDMQKFIGKTVQDDAFISTSVGGNAAFSHKPILLNIRAPRGTLMSWAKPISQYKSENEMTLAPGTKFKILNVSKPGSQIIVDVVVVP
jgi:F like protein/ADP-ribosyltransferase exoenzyme